MKENNEFKWDYTLEIRKKLDAGTVLLSEPFLNDFAFKRSVCLICDHKPEEGTFGFIINRKTNRKVWELTDELKGVDADVYYGGPVGGDSLYYLHDNRYQLDEAKQISENVFWGGNFEQLKSLLVNGEVDLSTIKFIIGYSGWDPGQLRKEIIENAWILNNEVSHRLIFSSSPKLWHDIMYDMDGIYRKMAQMPENPDLN
jgi:putative transcriptional regulator